MIRRIPIFLLLTFPLVTLTVCAWADPVLDRRGDPLEEAGRLLSRHLEEMRQGRAEVRRLRALEEARAVGIGVPQPKPATPDSQPVAAKGSSTLLAPAPWRYWARTTRESLGWLDGQNDSLQTTIRPIRGREGLLVSYTIPAGDPLEFLKGRSWTYDNAVGAVALLVQGNSGEASRILSTLQGLMNPQGTMGFSYQVNSGFTDSAIRTGALAWVGYAMAFYQRSTGDSSFQASAERIARYLITLRDPTGSLRGGPDVNWVSTEHNIDAYFFYRELNRVTGNTEYLSTAETIRASLLRNHWVRTANGGHFRQGLNDSTPSLDANSWGAIFLHAIGEAQRASQALAYVEAIFRNTQWVTGSSAGITGYAPDARRRTVWLEGTAGVAVAYLRTGQAQKAEGIFRQIANLQSAWATQGRWHGAFPYAMPRYRNADGDTFSDLESAASTGWILVSLSLRGGENSFWDPD